MKKENFPFPEMLKERKQEVKQHNNVIPISRDIFEEAADNIADMMEDIKSDVVEKVNQDAEPWKSWPTLYDLYKKPVKKKVWAVKGMIPAGLSIIAGLSKIGKTELIMNIIMNAGLGEKILGYIENESEPFKILYYFLEGDIEDATGKVECLYQNASGVERELFKGITFRASTRDQTKNVNEIKSLYNGGLEEIAGWLNYHKNSPRWVVIDTLQASKPDQKVRRKNQSNNIYEVQSDFLEDLRKLARRYQSPITVLHHLNKSSQRVDQKDTDITVSITGSLAMSAVPDAVMVLSRDRLSTEGLLQVIGRNGVKEKCYILEGQKLESTRSVYDDQAEDIDTVKWKISGETAKNVMDASGRKKSTKEALYELISSNPNTLGRKETVDLAVANNICASATAYNKLKELEKLKSIQEVDGKLIIASTIN